MLAEFIETYGSDILYSILTGVATYVGLVVKKLYKRYADDQTKKDVIKTVVKGIEQLHKDLTGAEKLDFAVDNASEILENKGITITDLELRMLIESAVGDFNDVFNKTVKKEEEQDG